MNAQPCGCSPTRACPLIQTLADIGKKVAVSRVKRGEKRRKGAA